MGEGEGQNGAMSSPLLYRLGDGWMAWNGMGPKGI